MDLKQKYLQLKLNNFYYYIINIYINQIIIMEILKTHKKQIYCVKKSKKNNFFVTGSEDNTIRLYDLRKKTSIKMINGIFINNDINSINFNEINEFEIISGIGKDIYIFDLRSPKIFINEYVNVFLFLFLYRKLIMKMR